MVDYSFDLNNLIESNRVTKENIAEIQQWIKNEQSIPKINEKECSLFLLACENDVDNTKKCIDCFYTVRRNTPELFENRNLTRDEVLMQLQIMEFVLIPQRTSDNYCIVLNRLTDSTATNYRMDTAMKLLLMVFDSVLYENPPNGIILIFDMTFVTLSHLTKTKLNILRHVLKYIQDGMPIRLKAIHVMNILWFFDKILSMVKPFMYKELLEKIITHKPDCDMNEFYEKYIPKTHLPSDYGGDLKSMKQLSVDTCKMLTDLSDYFLEEENQRKQYYNKEN